MRHDHQRFRHIRYTERQRFDKADGSPGPLLRYRHGGSRGGFGGRGEGKRFFERGKFKIALLELLASEPMHGYQLIKAMEEKTGGLYSPSPGSIYPNLQLLEDMQLIDSSETDGKKLYHITSEGLTYLRESGEADTERPESRWEHHTRHKLRGDRHGRHQLRELMKDWSDVIHMMAKAAEAAKEHPSSKQAEQFQELMTKFQSRLNEIMVTPPHEDSVESATGNDPVEK
ncbi:PadR family transcriptional regulator [Paenibacillus sp. GD4]|uniref:PadR family transcriptional regulator n=1 Tax=Paenibacillus sp. GD4 TaxID=3068890 RepID=UPI0027969C5D|nr:PadR family transcriptional regulator [Paenibacillus sp. GD4]MDQ1914480.1 PadR family transcriptional regulator [Paenibacillus sp. GD4]